MCLTNTYVEYEFPKNSVIISNYVNKSNPLNPNCFEKKLIPNPNRETVIHTITGKGKGVCVGEFILNKDGFTKELEGGNINKPAGN